MSTDASAEARDTDAVSTDESVTRKKTQRANTPNGTDAPKAWDLMRSGHEADSVHPYWTHIITAAGATLLGASLLSYLSMPWWGWALTLLGLAFTGGLLGAAVTVSTDQHLAAAGQAGGAAWFVATGGLGQLMAATSWMGDPYGPGSAPVWALWAAITLVGGVVHRYLWGRAVEAADPMHPRGAKIRAKRNNDLWSASFRRAGLGDVKVVSVTERWAGVDIVGRTDPEQATRASDVEAKADAVVDLVHKAMREQGSDEGLGLGEPQVFGKHNGARDQFLLRVRTKDPLVETIAPVWPTDEEWTISDHMIGIHLGYWDTGESMEVPPAGPHKVAAGATNSGKSTWLIALEVGYARRPHWVMWAAGTSKLMDLVQPAVNAANEVEGRPVFEMWGGGDSGDTGELTAAERQIAAAYMLYLDRARRSGEGKLPGRSGRNFIGTPENPWVALICDEFNDVLKRSAGRTVTLANKEKVSVWHMLVTLGEKARAYGIELVLVTQGTTNTAIGGSAQQASNDILANANTRFLFATSRGSAQQDILGSGKGDALAMAKDLESMQYACLASIRGQEASYAFGKTVFWDEDDLVHITRMANKHGTIGRLGADDQAALGELYVEGAQPQRPVGGVAPTRPSPDVSRASWGAPADQSEITQMANDLLASAGGPSSSITGDESDVDEDETEDIETDDGDFAEQAQAELDAILGERGEVSEDELTELRAQHGQIVRRPEEPEELLADILDVWVNQQRPAKRLTAREIVEMCELHWLDLGAETRPDDAAVAAQAASKLGKLLQDAPLWLEPRRTSSGVSYAREQLEAAYERIMDIDE